jgi:hypothetical protein
VFRGREVRGALLGFWQRSGFPACRKKRLARKERDMRKFFIMAIAVFCLGGYLQGCIPTAVAVYAVSRHRTHKSYGEYAADMEKCNQERQNQGLAPLPVLSFDEWKKNRKNLPKPGEEVPPAPAEKK